MNQEHIQFALPSSCRLCSNVAGPGSTTKKVLFFKNKLPNHMLNQKTYMYQRVSIYKRVSISLCFCINAIIRSINLTNERVVEGQGKGRKGQKGQKRCFELGGASRCIQKDCLANLQLQCIEQKIGQVQVCHNMYRIYF